ncbi:MAG: glutamate racemase [Clostridia bacterium]|nr:glutamate racemase [Clostridia bacterium]
MKNLILFFDSGIGGLSLLAKAQKLFKGNFLYVADFLNSPYGSKTKSQIKQIVLDRLSGLIKEHNPKCVVLACNTATAVSIDEVRKIYPNIFVVGCEPAIKPALKSGCKNILVLCTQATKKYSVYLKNFDNITICCPKKLAKLIDENFLFKEQVIKNYLNKVLKKFYGKFDGVVLGCTHYVLFKDYIQKILGCKVFDGNLGASKQILKFVKTKNNTNSLILVSTLFQKQQYLNMCYKKVKEKSLCVE